MDLKAEKEILKKELDQVNDARLLEAIRKILDYGRSKSGRPYKPMTEDEYFDRISESRKAIGEGKLIVQEEAIEYFRRKNG
ncbi:hypothetical protein KK083_08175 [Fulvivirgaceae bacterium PWU4]|uniref:Uncharacterized protein n=1 Tax=Chryseosolibacter histidini TaxID=2782349 RepID=A0AAP2DJV1_9BACT|nr:hypothetical protein [Chryseosolibacter histidini]MBT1696844.1 hypothetical protein [Chryseosolibacter histidini]